MGSHVLLQGIFLTQGLNPGLLQWQADSLPLSHLGSPCSYMHFVNTTCHHYQAGYPPWSSGYRPCRIWDILRVPLSESSSVLLYCHINQTSLFCLRFKLLMGKEIEGKDSHWEIHRAANILGTLRTHAKGLPQWSRGLRLYASTARDTG